MWRGQNGADIMTVPSFHRVVFLFFLICHVESFEPLQDLEVAFKIPIYELLDWNGLNQIKADMAEF